MVNARKISSVLEDFEEEVVGANEWSFDWPICLYDFLYKDKIKDHFIFKSQEIKYVDDYFGDGSGETSMVQSKIDFSLTSQNINFENLLIERNPHICHWDNLEGKFKVLFNNNISEFYLWVIHLISDDPFDELIDPKDKIEGFINIWSELINKHNLKLIYSGRKALYHPLTKSNDDEDDIKESKDYYARRYKNVKFVDNVEYKLSESPTKSRMKNQGVFEFDNNKLLLSNISIKINSCKRSQSVQEDDSFNLKYFPLEVYFSSPFYSSRSKSFKVTQIRKFLSTAQYLKIEDRYNNLKSRRKQWFRQKQLDSKFSRSFSLSNFVLSP